MYLLTNIKPLINYTSEEFNHLVANNSFIEFLDFIKVFASRKNGRVISVHYYITMQESLYSINKVQEE